MIEVLSDRKAVKARRNHLCNLCEFQIEKGVKYNKSSLKYDGILYTWKEHLHCTELSTSLGMYDHVNDEGLTGELFGELVQEEYDNIMRAKDEALYESDEYRHPEFDGQMKIVCQHHNILMEASNETTL